MLRWQFTNLRNLSLSSPRISWTSFLEALNDYLFMQLHHDALHLVCVALTIISSQGQLSTLSVTLRHALAGLD